MHPSGLLTVNAVEAYPLSDFSAEVSLALLASQTNSAHANRVILNEQNIRSGLAEAQRVANGSGSEKEKAEARVEVEVRSLPAR